MSRGTTRKQKSRDARRGNAYNDLSSSAIVVTESAIQKDLTGSRGALNEESTIRRIVVNAGSDDVKGSGLILVQLRPKLVDCMLFVFVVVV